MAGRIITISQQKGGAGKTTLAAQLAVGFLEAGQSVATIDIDPQGSLSLWYAARMASLGAKNKLIHSQVQGWRLKKEAERMAEDYDIVIIDSPPHTETEATIAIREADLVLIPMQASPMDLWASRPTIKTAQDEDTQALIVLNRIDTRTKLNAAIADKLVELDTKVAKASLGNRVAYAASMMEGKGVTETEKSSAAAAEINALLKELKKHDAIKLKKAA
ncbi:MAG: ParA family partition ATPase [Alphaproteobacteria bacterium]